MTGMEVALASGALKVAGDKLVSLIASEFASITGVKKDLSELHGKHLVISNWLASVHGRTIGDGTMVNELTNVADDIDDLLYGVHLEAEKHKLHGDGDRQPIADCFCSIPKSFLFRCKVARKIKEIKAKYEKIVKQSSDANIIRTNLQIDHPVRRSNWTAGELSMLSNVEDSKIPTRDKEKGEIISKILESDEGEDGRTVVSIVGLGGSGKTTLAKLICHDSKIKEHFKDMVFWVHVSEEYDVNKLIAKLFEAIIEKKADFHAQQNMLRELSKKLSGKKFFLVLDDAWHEDKYDWEQFMVHLKNGVPGSKILVTTRNKKVAEIVKSRHIFELGFLSEAETWSFFLMSCGLVEENLGSEYIQVGKEILKRCSGVPLAIRTLGSMLCETNEISIWKAIRDSDLWTDESTKGRVFASLKLSFIHMEDEVKQCFIFCSIFPKGYEIYKDRLIAQWVANGFINAMNGVQPEDIGRGYFDSLVKVGFLQGPYYESWQSKQLVCKMHDVIHDLVRDILLNNAQSCRYLSLTSCAEKVDRGSFDKVHAIFVSESNPTFDKPVKKSSRVRSVVLDYRNNTLFPQFILKFEYIGYLEIHNPSCTKFPEAISDCWNLQSLHFISCYRLVTLPKSIGKLKKLRTLELNSAYYLESLPQSIGECRGLQYLHLHNCVRVSEIPSTIFNVRNLRGLHITKFSYLKQLPLEFTGEFSNLQTINFAGSKLCYLPSMLSCPTLCTLDLSQTEVTILPQWVTTIGTLKCINLYYCQELVELPEGIGNLKGLSVLNITSCNKLKCIPSGIGQLTRLTQLGLFVVGCGEDDARISELGNLGKLRGFMEIRNLEFLKDPCDAAKARLKEKNKIQYLELNWSWSQPEVDLATDVEQQQAVLSALEPPSQIESLEINCYRGPCLPSWMIEQTILCQFLSLTNLRLCGFRNLKHMRGLLKFPSLKSLELSVMANLEDLWTTTSGFEVRAEDCFPALSVVSIRDCPKFITVKPYFPPSLELRLHKKCNLQLLSPGNFSHLRELQLVGTTGPSSAWEFLQHRTELEILSIHEYNDLTQLPDSIRSLTSLQELHIEDCPTLGALPEWLGELCSLRSLVLSSTPMIASLPQSIGCLTSLTRLQIWDGSKLKQLPECIGQLSALRKLLIEGCSALECLPESIQRLTALQNLVISGCPALARRYKQGVGPDWHLLSHIPDVTIFEEH